MTLEPFPVLRNTLQEWLAELPESRLKDLGRDVLLCLQVDLHCEASSRVPRARGEAAGFCSFLGASASALRLVACRVLPCRSDRGCVCSMEHEWTVPPHAHAPFLAGCAYFGHLFWHPASDSAFRCECESFLVAVLLLSGAAAWTFSLDPVAFRTAWIYAFLGSDWTSLSGGVSFPSGVRWPSRRVV